MTQDFYAILGIEEDADANAVKRAYRQIARKYHPDRNAGDEEAANKFRDAAEAYRVLGDSELRAEYDAYRKGGPGGMNIPKAPTEATGDVLNDLFGTSRKKQRRDYQHEQQQQQRSRPSRAQTRSRSTRHRGGAAPERGNDLRYDLEIDFEESINGAEHVVYVPGDSTCRTCAGTGAEPGSAPVICQRCGGRGTVREQQGFFDSSRRCPDCDGAGKMSPYACQACDGSGVEQVDRPVTVEIPPGVKDGTRLRMRGVGAAGVAGGPSGDLVVAISVREHPFFDRDGDDLLVEVPVTMTQAVLGDHVEIPTLNGPMRMKVPPGSQNGRVFRLQGQGPPRADGRGNGDQRVKIQVRTPTDLTDEMRQLIERFADLEDEYEPEEEIRDYNDRMKRYYRRR